jgi:hypothetical protein
MAATRPRYSKERYAKLGESIFETKVRPHLRGGNENDFVAIDIETGAYEIDADEQAACNRLSLRVPAAQIWLRRVGSRHARHFGGHQGSATP